VNNLERQKGQTVIEMALIIILLLMLLFGIAEIARAWWFKGQLNNAARVGVRVAVVTPSLTSGGACAWGGTCGTASSDNAVIAACQSITNQELCNTANVAISQVAVDPPAGIQGDEITVTVTGTFGTIVRGLSNTLPMGWGQSLIQTDAGGNIPLAGRSVMRHE
jgi:Flp pilus assembly protein TadG